MFAAGSWRPIIVSRRFAIMRLLIFGLLLGLSLADPTSPPKARRSSSLCDYNACPLTSVSGVDMYAMQVAGSTITCFYSSSQCSYNYMTAQLDALDSINPADCPALTCVPPQACVSYGCPAIPGLGSPLQFDRTTDGMPSLQCIWMDLNCSYEKDNGALLAGSTDGPVLSCPNRLACLATGSRRRQYQPPQVRRSVREGRSAELTEFEDAHQPW
ncbi:hypothetical protein CALCODRAFT_502950 [Calocera cornea HHB12733]|uniref:Uncharacterized protein n=1 Tax=Calocera cornea HHB12733 TaxID=1353952 RepID=A0A165D2C7_9BASI|nr:hypothetical protein CALCODRAFT_502950 [Calocera cornea HHB12733]